MKKQSKKTAVAPNTMTVRFVKAADFRVVHGTGAMLNQSPQSGHTRFTIYCDRFPFPEVVTHEFITVGQGQGRLGNPIAGEESLVHNTIERELQVEVNMPHEAFFLLAQEIGTYLKWLQEQRAPKPEPQK